MIFASRAFTRLASAAESEEFGLEAGRVGETNSVKLLTVHAAVLGPHYSTLDVALHWQFARLTAPALAGLTREIRAAAAKVLIAP